METKVCSKCGIEYELNDYNFRRRKDSKDGFRNQCRKCNGINYAPPRPIAKQGFHICYKCGRELPLSEKYFIISSQSKTGFHTRCRECEGIEFKPDKPIPKEGHKFCSKCGEEFPDTTEFFNVKRENSKFLDARCKKCKSIYDKQYWANNTEKHIENARNSYLKNKEKVLVRSKIRYESKKEKINEHHREFYQEHKEEYSIRHKNYDKTERGKFIGKFKSRKRRVLLKKCKSDLTYKQWLNCLKFFDFKDAYTGLPMNIESIDHIIPVSKKGNHTANNVIPCDMPINASKSNKDMEKWYKKQPFYSQERLNKIYEWININQV